MMTLNIKLRLLLLISVCMLNTLSLAQINTEPQPCVPAWNQFAGADRISSTIMSSVRDNDGLIYLGGRDGLYRIEGGAVKTWYPDFTDPEALPAGQIRALAKQGNYIWVGTGSGVSRLNTTTGIFERNDSLNQANMFSSINALLVINGYLFVGSESGGYIAKLDDDISKITIINLFENTKAIRDFIVDEQEVMAAAETGLWTINIEGEPRKADFDGEDLLAFARANNTTWLISADSLYQKKRTSHKWQRFTHENLPGLPDSEFTALTTDIHGDLWIGARKGISRWSKNEQQPTHCRRAVVGSNRDQDISIAHLSGELGNHMFLGSRGSGATYAPLGNDIRRIVPGERFNAGLPNNAIWSHTIDSSGYFYAGTSRGLFVETHPGSGHFNAIAPEILGQHRIYNLLETQDNKLWIGTAKGLFIKVGGTVESVPMMFNGTDEPVTPAVFDMVEYSGSVLVATSRGLVELNPESLKVESFFKTKADVHPINKSPETTLPISRIWSIDIFGNRTFIAGNEGAFEVDLATTRVVSSTLKSVADQRQPIGYIYNITAVDEDRLFLGTEAGLVETDPEFSYFNKISEINGMKLKAVMSSGHDARGNIWLGVANSGLFQYQPDKKQWSHLTQSKGLITNGVSQLGLSFSSDGRMSVSNGTGASIVNLDTINLSAEQPLNVRAVDGPRNHMFLDNETYKIGPEERDLKLSFLATDLIQAGMYQIRYRLKTTQGDIQEETIPIDEILSFVNLAPGIYDFSAEVISTYGTTSRPLSFKFSIQPYWWETNVLILLIMIGLAMSFLAYLSYRTRLNQERLELIGEERKRIAQDLHDTSLQDLFGVKMMGRNLLSADTKTNEQETVNRFMALVDQSIQSLRDSVNSISDLTNVPPLSSAVKEIKECQNFRDDIDIVVRETGQPWPIRQQRRFFLYRMIREATNNACKHSNASTVNITMTWSAFSLLIEVSDDGNGFDVQAQQQSDTYGLRSMQRMASSAKVHLDVQSVLGEGSSISIRTRRRFL